MTSHIGSTNRFKNKAEERIFLAIQNSTHLSNSTLIQVGDLSAWYEARKSLGPRRHIAHVIRDADRDRRYSASIYDFCSEYTARGRLTTSQVARRNLGNFSSLVLAHRRCRKARHERNQRIADTRNPNYAPSHLYLVLVSSSFLGKKSAERVEMVYEALLREFYRPCFSNSSRNIRGFGTVGRAVAALSQFQHLGDMSFEILLDLRDTKEYQSAIPLRVNWYGNTLRTLHGLVVAEQPLDSRRELKRLQKVYQIDLSSALVKVNMVNNKSVEHQHTVTPSDNLLQNCGKSLKVAKNEDFSPAMSESEIGWPRKGNDGETSMVVKTGANQEQITTAALWLQRIYRCNQIPKMQKRWFLRQKTAVHIQRIHRGRHHRQLARKWRIDRDQAVIVLQSFLRGATTRCLSGKRRTSLTILALSTQTAVRGWRSRKNFKWMKFHTPHAIKAQKVVRGFLGRSRVLSMKEKREVREMHLAAKAIQATVRVFLDKCRLYRVTFVVPLAIRCQARRRAVQATDLFLRRKSFNFAVLHIQRIGRGFLVKLALQAIRCEDDRQKYATRIQSIVRGFIQRAIMVRIREMDMFHYVFIANAVKLQCHYREYRERNRNRSARIIQGAYLRSRKVLASKQKGLNYVASIEQYSASVIQSKYRGWRDRVATFRALDFERGKRLLAARTIVNAWKSWKSKELIRASRNLQKYESSIRVVLALQRDKVFLRNKINILSGEIAKRKKKIMETRLRLKELKVVHRQSTSRIVAIESNNIFTESDTEIQDERRRLKREICDVDINIETCRTTIKFARDDMLCLVRERDKHSRRDMESIAQLLVEEQEKMRIAEIQKRIALKDTEWRKRVREERRRWRVTY